MIQARQGQASATRVLVVDDERGIRELLGDILGNAGFDVIQAASGSAGLQQAWREGPDVIVLDLIMPNMDGFEVLTQLRRSPSTQDVPVVLLTALPPEKGEYRGMKLGVSHYLAKPWLSGTVELAVRSALREAGGDDELPPLATGEEPVDRLLGGGFPHGSLVVIEGTSPGASALNRYLLRGSLDRGYDVVYYAERSGHALLARMDSAGAGVSTHRRRSALSFRSIYEGPCAAKDTMEWLAHRIEEDVRGEGPHRKAITVDTITRAATAGDDRSVLAFFARCRQACDGGVTIILICHPAGFAGHLLHRIRDISDFYIRAVTEASGETPVDVLEALKVRGVETTRGNRLALRIGDDGGIRALPATRKLRV